MPRRRQFETRRNLIERSQPVWEARVGSFVRAAPSVVHFAAGSPLDDDYLPLFAQRIGNETVLNLLGAKEADAVMRRYGGSKCSKSRDLRLNFRRKPLEGNERDSVTLLPLPVLAAPLSWVSGGVPRRAGR